MLGQVEAGVQCPLAMTYGACFGVEIFIHNIAASYYVDQFGLSLQGAGFAAICLVAVTFGDD